MADLIQPKTDTAPGLQEGPVSLDTAATAGIDADKAIQAQFLENELTNRYDLSSEAKTQLAESIHSLPTSTHQNLREALAHPELTPGGREQLIESVHAMLTAPRNAELQNPAQRQELVSSMLQTLANPLSAHQSDRRTCSVVSAVQTRMALTDPAEYARILEGLTSESGAVELASGNSLLYIERSAQPDMSLSKTEIVSRSLESRILQSAYMQYGAGYEKDATGEFVLAYEPARDVFLDRMHGNETSGMYSNWQQRLTNDVFNEGSTRFDTSNVAGVATPAQDVIAAMQQQLEGAGTPVAVEVNWADQGDHAEHIMLVTEVRDGRVYFFNGWRTFSERDGSNSHSHELSEDGKIESMSVEDFGKRLRSAYIADPEKTAAEAELTELQTERYYNPRVPETYHPHIRPPSSTYESKETASSSSQAWGAEEGLHPEDPETRPRAAGHVTDRNAELAAAAQRNSQSIRVTTRDDDIFS